MVIYEQETKIRLTYRKNKETMHGQIHKEQEHLTKNVELFF